MIKISYGRMFLGGAILNGVCAFLYIIIGLIAALIGETDLDSARVNLGTILLEGLLYLTLGSIVSGVFSIIALAIFGKKEENIVYLEKPQEKIIYVVKDEKKDRTDDYSRYMPK